MCRAVSVRHDRKAVERGGDGGTATRVYLTSLNHTLQRAESGTFPVVYILSQLQVKKDKANSRHKDSGLLGSPKPLTQAGDMGLVPSENTLSGKTAGRPQRQATATHHNGRHAVSTSSGPKATGFSHLLFTLILGDG